jgi:tetratricopeptide (TPR) repeat protein
MSNKNYEIGIAFLDNSDFKKSIEFLTKSIEEDPDNSEAYENRALAFYYLQDDFNALNDLDKAIELDPTNQNALVNRALQYSNREDWDKAITDFLAAHEIYNESVDVLENLVYCGLRKRDFVFAQKYVNEFLKINPDDKWAKIRSADVACGLKEYDKAIKIVSGILREDPANAVLLNYLGYCCMKVGKLEESEYYYKTALTYDPEFAYAIDNLGHLEYLRKNYHKAKELINRSIDLDPSNSYAFKSRALVYIAEENKDAAFIDLKHAETLGFKEDWGEEVEELLEAHFPNDLKD